MSKTSRRLLRLVAVVAMITAVLVPAVTASAASYNCDGATYDALNPAHAVYGRTVNTPVDTATRRMVVDLSGATMGTLLFWDGAFPDDPATGLVSLGATITGSKYGDSLCGTIGNDVIKGKKGPDHIFGNGSASDYNFVTGLGGDQLFGNAGHDLIDNTGNAFSGLMKGAKGNDTLRLGNNLLSGGADQAYGGNGNDSLYAGTGGFQILSGNTGDDSFYGNIGACVGFWGGKGADSFAAGAGFGNWFSGDADDDSIAGLGLGAAQVGDGGPGNDSVSGSALGVFQAWYFGGVGDDTLSTGPALSVAFGDYINPLTVAPFVAPAWAGGPGTCWASSAGTQMPVNASAAGNDTLTGSAAAFGAMWAWGGPGDDKVRGSSFADGNLWGEDGNDWIEGRAGSDAFIVGGFGDDTMYGNTPTIFGGDTADAAIDRMIGNAGNDKYFGSECGRPAVPTIFNSDSATELAGEGNPDSARGVFNASAPPTLIENETVACI